MFAKRSSKESDSVFCKVFKTSQNPYQDAHCAQDFLNLLEKFLFQANKFDCIIKFHHLSEFVCCVFYILDR